MLVSLLGRVLRGRRDGDRFGARLREGYSRLQAGDVASARQIALDLLSRDSALVPAHLLLAQAAADGGEWSVAFPAIERILAIDPDRADAYFIRGMMHEQLGDAERAIADYDVVLQIDSSHTAALDRKGRLHDVRGEFTDSLVCAERLIRADSTSAYAHHKLGITLREIGRLRDAEQALRAAIALDAGFHDAHCHLALVLIDQGLFDEADALLASVLAQNADHAEARWTRAVSNLLRSRFDVAWDDYEWREHRRENPLRVSGVPEWDGSRIEGGYLLISSEQGLGDQIMFSSCIEDALRLSPACVIECDPRLVALFRRSFPRARVHAADAKSLPQWLPQLSSPLVAQLPMGSLPGQFRRRASDFPAHSGYLVPDAAAVASWRQRLSELGPGPKIGLSWTGGALKTRRRLRSLKLEQLVPLFRAGDCHFVSLQYVDSRKEIEALQAQHGVTVHEFEETQANYDQTVALIGALDLVISVCTAAIHLAGAIGTPVWIIAPAAPEWRYLASGAGMPWYSGAKIWRQAALGEWDPVIQVIAGELASFCSMHTDGKGAWNERMMTCPEKEGFASCLSRTK